jgi:lipopolysaccharide transport system ATP-binding protein
MSIMPFRSEMIETIQNLPKSDNEVLVRVDGVSKKFCRSLKKSLWYGVCDIAGELLPGRKRQRVTSNELRVTGENTSAEGGTGAQVLRGERVPQAGPQGFAGRENSEPNLAEGDSGLVTRNQLPATPEPDRDAWNDDLREGEFYAVKDVSFELRRGECMGLIGHNGAGKTTLLKMLNGLIKPDRGSITMRGRVGALIALGAGFNPILTGRENIYVSGAVLGLSKREIDSRVDEIIDFSELGDFIDSPVQNYSSGMAVRLGFSVASTLEPDILILDEVLAVGDERFRTKCHNRIGTLLNKAAVIFVSHNMNQIAAICSSCYYMKRGSGLGLQHVSSAIDEYNHDMKKIGEVGKAGFNEAYHPLKSVICELITPKIESAGQFELALNISSHEEIRNVSIRITVDNVTLDPQMDWNSKRASMPINIPAGKSRILIKTGPFFLRGGFYPLTIFIRSQIGGLIFYSRNELKVFMSTETAGAPFHLPQGEIECMRVE